MLSLLLHHSLLPLGGIGDSNWLGVCDYVGVGTYELLVGVGKSAPWSIAKEKGCTTFVAGEVSAQMPAARGYMCSVALELERRGACTHVDLREYSTCALAVHSFVRRRLFRIPSCGRYMYTAVPVYLARTAVVMW